MRCEKRKTNVIQKSGGFLSFAQSERTETKEIGLQFTDKIARMSFL